MAVFQLKHALNAYSLQTAMRLCQQVNLEGEISSSIFVATLKQIPPAPKQNLTHNISLNYLCQTPKIFFNELKHDVLRLHLIQSIS